EKKKKVGECIAKNESMASSMSGLSLEVPFLASRSMYAPALKWLSFNDTQKPTAIIRDTFLLM
ncbi:hypothetical protein WUBG_10845, partial [Wuchereria bancrofti]